MCTVIVGETDKFTWSVYNQYQIACTRPLLEIQLPKSSHYILTIKLRPGKFRWRAIHMQNHEVDPLQMTE